LSFNNQTGTTYTFALTDANASKLVTFGNSGATTATVPAYATVAWPAGSVIDFEQKGAGKVTVAGATGVTIVSQSSYKSLLAQYCVGTLIHTDTQDTWLLLGSLTT
jgi:hypothetical protein